MPNTPENRVTRTASVEGPPPEDELAPGYVLMDRYRVEERIGRGGMGFVYRGEHLTVGRKVAIKVLAQQWARNREVVERFRAEARSASAVGHANIVQVFDAGQLPDGRLFLVMEFLSGRNLYEEVERNGPLEPLRACRIVLDVARAIRAAHACNIIHRDLKGENVVLVQQPEGEVVKVLDFGVATIVGDDGPERLTRPGIAVGTPETMAPEQAQGLRPSQSFDIYALGCLLFEGLVGQPPFVADTPLVVVANKLKERAPSIATRRRDLPASLCRLVDACLERRPEDRPASADEVCRQLEHVIAVLEGRLPAEPITPEGARTRSPRVWVAAGAAGLIAVFGVVLWGRQSEPEQASAAAVTAVQNNPAAATTREVELGGAAAQSVPPHGTVETSAGPELTLEPAPMTETATDRPAEVAPTHSRKRTGRTRASSSARETVGLSETARCDRVRKAAIEARTSHIWGSVLRHTQERECWSSGAEPRKLRVQALMELERFSDCAKEGKGIQDPEVQKWVRTCERRAQSG